MGCCAVGYDCYAGAVSRQKKRKAPSFGANLFNLVLVSGISITVSPFAVPTSATIAGQNASLVLEIPLMLFVMLFMTIPALTKKKLYRFQGIALLAIYAAFCIFQFTL